MGGQLAQRDRMPGHGLVARQVREKARDRIVRPDEAVADRPGQQGAGERFGDGADFVQGFAGQAGTKRRDALLRRV